MANGEKYSSQEVKPPSQASVKLGKNLQVAAATVQEIKRSDEVIANFYQNSAANQPKS